MFKRRSRDRANPMDGINPYTRELSEQEIDNQAHRKAVGGMWDEIGGLQFEFLRQQGLRADHYLADVGCGALRGGIHFVRYLEPSHYCGMDINASLIEAGRRELRQAGIEGKQPHLLVSDSFALTEFATHFDYALAISLFTHLTMNHIVRCLVEVRKVLRPEGAFYATFFQAPRIAHTAALTHSPGEIVTHYDRDPFHYAFEEMRWMADAARMQVRLVGHWAHPRDQRMLCFSAASE